jgi:hypothetical protein
MSNLKYVSIGLICGLILGIGSTALAATLGWKANLSSQGVDTVNSFTDGDNKCYVVKGRVTESRAFAGYGYAISCVSNKP